jgi:hypothetical protein
VYITISQSLRVYSEWIGEVLEGESDRSIALGVYATQIPVQPFQSGQVAGRRARLLSCPLPPRSLLFRALRPCRRLAHNKRQYNIDGMYRDAVPTEHNTRRNEDQPESSLDTGSQPATSAADQSDDLTLAFVRLSNLPTYPLDRLSRYEATLWQPVRPCSHCDVSPRAGHRKN